MSLLSESSSVWRTTVQPLGNGLWCVLSSWDLKNSPAKEGVTVKFWPSGRCTMVGVILASDYRMSFEYRSSRASTRNGLASGAQPCRYKHRGSEARSDRRLMYLA